MFATFYDALVFSQVSQTFKRKPSGCNLARSYRLFPPKRLRVLSVFRREGKPTPRICDGSEMSFIAVPRLQIAMRSRTNASMFIFQLELHAKVLAAHWQAFCKRDLSGSLMPHVSHEPNLDV